MAIIIKKTCEEVTEKDLPYVKEKIVESGLITAIVKW